MNKSVAIKSNPTKVYIFWNYNKKSFFEAVLEIKKKSRLSLFQKPGNQSHEFGCPIEKPTHLSALLRKTSIQPRSLVFPCFLRFSLSFFFLVACIHLAQFSFLLRRRLYSSKKTATFALSERQYLCSVLLIEDIKDQNRNIKFENNRSFSLWRNKKINQKLSCAKS